MENKGNRGRRVVAFFIDLMLFYIPCVLSAFFLWFSFLGIFSIGIVSIAVISFFVILVLRDYLFHGHSIGKRMMKLKVVDADTFSEPSSKQLIVKNLFLFLSPIDGVFFIATGRSLGERATHTIVMREQQLPRPDSADGAVQERVSTKKRAAVAVVAVLCISLFMFLICATSLNAIKKQEHYQIAHSYLINSDAYAKMQAEESQIILTGYSSGTRVAGSGDCASEVVTFTFFVQGKQYQVVCHREGEAWYVCNECTAFQ